MKLWIGSALAGYGSGNTLMGSFVISLQVALLAFSLHGCGGNSSTPPSPPVTGASVTVYVTTGDQSKLLHHEADVQFSATPASGSIIIFDGTRRYQTMDGFGASLTDSSATVITQDLTTAQRTQLMSDLFDPSSGIGLSFLRQPMGASDFSASGNYSYDEMPAGQSDPTLANFSIAHDSVAIIPLLKQAISLNPNLKVVAVPWSPPAWMKTSSTMNGGSVDPAQFAPLAQYFVKFVQAYQAQNIPIYAILPQNEPLYSTSSYPSTEMSATDEANFIGNFLGPSMTAAGLNQVKIIAYDHNWDHPEYPQAVLADATASAYVAGTAFHCYAGDPSGQVTVHSAYPTKDIWFTECSGTVGSSFAGDLKWNADKLLIGAVRNYARSVSLWNLVLDQDSGPKNGGCSNCRALVTVDNTASPSRVTYNVEYYVLGHLAKFVKPGACRVDTTSNPGGIETVGFVNPDGSKVLLALNQGASADSFTAQQGTLRFSYTLPAGALATFSWK
ncbi:MAG: glycoside hydrolase family 30 beta sandwich domain-containing protein [Terriglobia bacterium]|nr:glycoside hydrolase family 30 beta sandwich domain-containing protein [Terriglobia bacterium]